jgi:hypothetical protein
MTVERVHRLSHQSWTPDNLCVESFHQDIRYYTCRWDALCPYIDVDAEMLAMAKKPFIVYAVPPEGPYGVPITDHYGLVHVKAPDFWRDPLRERKFKKLDKAFKGFRTTERVVAGKDLTLEQLFVLGGEHFSAYEIHDLEVSGLLDYVQNLDTLIIQVHADSGELVLTDVSILLPARQQVYGSFCQWNYAFKNRSPGLYACLLASRWAARHGYRHYNLGPVGDYPYKNLFVTDLEPIYAIAITDPHHPLALDSTSPLHTDFSPEAWNQIYRSSV